MKTTALRDPRIAAFLKSHRWDQVKIAPLDRQQWRVTVQNGPYSVLDATVTPVGIACVLGAGLSWGCANNVVKRAARAQRVDMLAFVVWTSIFALPPV